MNSSNESLNNLKHERYGKLLQRRRVTLYALQWFFLSALFTLTPFLYSTHGTELGLSTLERTWIHMFSSLILTLICTIALHRDLHSKLLIHFKPLLVTFLIIAALSHIALLFVPRTQRIARYPKITLNCTTSGSLLLRIELCPNLIKSDSLLNHPSNVHSNIQSQYSSFQCDQLLSTSSSSRWKAEDSPKSSANHYFQNERFYRDSNRDSNYNNEFTTFSMQRCKGVCPIDFQTKYEANKEQMLRYYERSNVHNRNSKKLNSKPYDGVMDSEYDIFNGRTQICFRKSSDSKTCYTPDPDTVESSLNNFQSSSSYVHNIINFPALNSTIYRVKQIRFHSKIQSWQPVSTIPQLPDLMYPYPSCLFSQVVPVFMDGQSFENIICPNPLENTRYSKASINENPHRSPTHENNVDSYYELNSLDQSSNLNANLPATSNDASNYYQTNCDTICNTNLIYRGQLNGKYYGHHSMQLPYSPIVCNDIVGDPLITFYSYLVIRCIADLSLMICFLVIDSLSVYYSANFDTIYGGFQKAVSLGTSAFIWPIISGFLVDYYSSITGKADYSPAFILFVGFILIGCSLVVSLQIAPSTSEFNSLVRNNHNISNTFIADLCGSNLNCDKLDHHKHTMYSSRPELNQLIKVSLKSKLMLVLIIPFIVLLGLYFSLTQLQMNTYYLSIGASRLWIGLVISLGFLFSTIFILIVKPLLSAIGRLNLIVLGFIFYALQFLGNSLLQANVKWSLLPFNLMTAFSFVLSWIGMTAHLHYLMKLNRLGHVKLQLSVGLIHFGYGRILASVVWFFWFYYYDQLKKCWLINYFIISEFDNRPINRIEMLEEMNAFRVLIRILGLFAFVFAIVFFVFYHLLAKCDQVSCHWTRDHESRKNRRLVNKSKEEDDDDLDKIEEEEYLTKSNKQEIIPKLKNTKVNLINKTERSRKKVYKPLAFFQTKNEITKDKKNEKDKGKDKNKVNKRKPSVNIIKINRVNQNLNKSNRKIIEEMV